MKKLFKSIKRIIVMFILLIILFVAYVFYDGYKLYKNVVAKTPIVDMVDIIQSKEDYLEFSQIPSLFADAIVAVEDHRFYYHNGFDIISFTRAMVKNAEEKSLVQGGSTITQQLAKNLYFSFEKKFSRKVAELFVVYDLENNYSKKDILALYINSVYFGDGYYGLNAASHGYFNKDVDDLTEDEITLLAGLPNAPSAYALSTHEELARKRQQIVIECLKNYDNNMNNEE